PALHSFPTRRSSDLAVQALEDVSDTINNHNAVSVDWTNSYIVIRGVRKGYTRLEKSLIYPSHAFIYRLPNMADTVPTQCDIDDRSEEHTSDSSHDQI